MQATSLPKRGTEFFFITLVVLAFIRVVLQTFANLPLTIVPLANVLMGCLFLGGPLLALCFAAKDQWSFKMAVKYFVFGMILQISCNLLLSYVFQKNGLPAEVLNALGQIGLPIWCVGLGAMLALLIKDRNIVVPIAIFLACLDMFLVFSPMGLTKILIKQAPALLPAFAVQIPAATHQTTSEKISPGALAGPADFLFLAMFLVALFRYNMRGRHTVMVVIPTLLGYMLLVKLVGVPLPALVPIGGVVLLVNWKEFQLSRDEKISTGIVAAMGIALFTWGMFQKPTVVRVDSLPPAGVQATPKSPS